MAAYYNEIEPYCVEWLRNLIKAGLIADGVVDNRSIRDVQPGDLRGFEQCHFFAGLGGWSLALRLAEWADDRPVWTGSCPCQPFSSAGAQKGFADDRHLWPDWFRLIAERRPATVFGEQVTSGAGPKWLALVRSDLEAVAYAVGAMPIEAACAGARQKRDRFWFVARTHGDGEPARSVYAETPGAPAALADVDSEGLAIDQRFAIEAGAHGRPDVDSSLSAGRGRYGRWTESPLVRLVHGLPARVGRVRAYGNAIYPPAAAEFIKAADAR